VKEVCGQPPVVLRRIEQASLGTIIINRANPNECLVFILIICLFLFGHLPYQVRYLLAILRCCEHNSFSVMGSVAAEPSQQQVKHAFHTCRRALDITLMAPLMTLTLLGRPTSCPGSRTQTTYIAFAGGQASTPAWL